MDATSATFKGVKAGLTRITHNAAVDANTEAHGTMLLKRSSPHDVRTLVSFTDPASQVFVGNGVAQIFYPKIETIQEYKLNDKYRTAFEQFYLLAFGGSGKDLTANYDVTYIGPETAGGSPSSHLQLIPKNPEVKKAYTKLDLWLTEAKATPSQLRLSQPSGDTTTFVYSDVVLNPKMSDSDLKLKTPKGVHIQYPGQ